MPRPPSEKPTAFLRVPRGRRHVIFALTANGTKLRSVAHLSPIPRVPSLILHSAFGLRETIADGVADQTYVMAVGLVSKFNAVSLAHVGPRRRTPRALAT
jgi:hypothetical protein